LRIAHHREGVDGDRKTLREQAQSILNPLAAVIKAALGDDVLTAKINAPNAARNAVVKAVGGGINEG